MFGSRGTGSVKPDSQPPIGPCQGVDGAVGSAGAPPRPPRPPPVVSVAPAPRPPVAELSVVAPPRPPPVVSGAPAPRPPAGAAALSGLFPRPPPPPRPPRPPP